MSEDLQSLLEKIQKDGVDKAEAEAEAIVARAREQAAATEETARNNAKQLLEDAERRQTAMEERTRRSLQQAARDVVITVHEAVQQTVRSLVCEDVRQTMNAEAVGALLVKAAETALKAGIEGKQVDFLVNPDQQKAVTSYVMAKLGDKIREGIEIKGDPRVVSGFRISFVNDRVEHDFSEEAIADALCAILRPQLAEIVNESRNVDTSKKD